MAVLDLSTTRLKFFLIVFLITILNVVLYVEYIRRVDLVYSMLGKETEDTAHLVSRIIKRLYYVEYLDITRTMDPNTPEYTAVKNFLVDCRESSKFKFIFSFKFIDDNKKIVCIIDSENENSPSHMATGSISPVDTKNSTLASLPITGNKPMHDISPHKDNGQIRISGYAPVKGDDGKIIGYIGVDLDGATIEAEIWPKRVMYLTTMILINIIFFGTLFTLGRTYRHGLKQQKAREELVIRYLRGFDSQIKERLNTEKIRVLNSIRELSSD